MRKVLVFSLLVLLAACGGSSSSKTATTTTTTDPSGPPLTVISQAPTPGGNPLAHLAVGQTATLPDGATVKISQVDLDVPPASDETMPEGTKSLGFVADVCAAPDAATPLSVSGFQFSMRLSDNTTTMASGSSAKKPIFANADLLAGECNHGWVTLAYPAATPPQTVRYTEPGASGDAGIAQWDVGQ